MRTRAKPVLLLAVFSAAVLCALAALLRSGRVVLTLPASTPAVTVIAGAIVAAGLALLLVRSTRLVGHIRAALPARTDPSLLFDDLADLADLARGQGLLVAAADPRTRRHRLLLAGLHLLCEDADRRLIRSALEGQAETQANRTASSRSAIIFACRGAMAAGGLGVVVSLGWTALSAASPWAMAPAAAALSAAGFGIFAIATAVAIPVIHILRRLTAAEELAASSIVETVLAIQANEDGATVRRRLETLVPAAEPGRGELVRAAREAA